MRPISDFLSFAYKRRADPPIILAGLPIETAAWLPFRSKSAAYTSFSVWGHRFAQAVPSPSGSGSLRSFRPFPGSPHRKFQTPPETQSADLHGSRKTESHTPVFALKFSCKQKNHIAVHEKPVCPAGQTGNAGNRFYAAAFFLFTKIWKRKISTTTAMPTISVQVPGTSSSRPPAMATIRRGQASSPRA